MRRLRWLSWVCFVFSMSGFAQQAPAPGIPVPTLGPEPFLSSVVAQPRFEVVAIHSSNLHGGVMGGPGTGRPELVTFNGAPLSLIIMNAFEIGRLRSFQISGPEWIKDVKYDIQAKVPPGSTAHDLVLMLQDMLKERFKMVVHHESREFPSYELKLLKGDPHLSEGHGGMLSALQLSQGMEIESRGRELSVLAMALEMNALHAAVTDKTGLTGTYNYKLHFSVDADMRSEFSFPSLQTALEDIGLKLEKGKGTFEVVVIDHIERAPTEN